MTKSYDPEGDASPDGVQEIFMTPNKASDAEQERASAPRRVQLSRKLGWKMPENTVSVARPGKWGNPYRMGYDGDRTNAVGMFRQYAARTFTADQLGELRGKNLGCWCRPEHECHADILLELANREPSP